MLRFQEYIQLNERRKADPEIRAYLESRQKPYGYWLSSRWTTPLPISRTMMKRLQNSEEDKAGLHSTDIPGLKRLISIQGTKKQISAFTQVQDVEAGFEMVQGVETSGGIIVKIKGDIPFRGDFDIFTSSDSQGRRWLDLKDFKNNKTIQKNNPNFFVNYELGISKIIEKHTNKFVTANKRDMWAINLVFPKGDLDRNNDARKVFWIGSQGYRKSGVDAQIMRLFGESGVLHAIGYATGEMLRDENPNTQLIMKLNNSLSKKIKQTLFKMTKELFDYAEKYMEDNWFEFVELGRARDDSFLKTAAYNEVVMDKIKIKKIFVDGLVFNEDQRDEIREIASGLKIQWIDSSTPEWGMFFDKWLKGAGR